jgi:uncharacterized protein YndB with AHSA1/START domain
MTKKILMVVVALVVVLCIASVVISLQPGAFRVERTAILAAPPSRAFDQVNDLGAWNVWSPWEELDPTAKEAVSAPSAGKGATLSWSGNDKVGEGSLTILESKPDERIEIEQAFVRPFEGKARMTFTFAPAGEGTRVTWKMEGTNGFIGKAMCLFMDMDAVIGKDFEHGLAHLKAVVEPGGPAAEEIDTSTLAGPKIPA